MQEIPDQPVEELKQYTDEEIEETNATAIEKELQTAENFLKAAKPNLAAIQVRFFRSSSVFIIEADPFRST